MQEKFTRSAMKKKGQKMQRANLPMAPVQVDSSIAIKISMGGSMLRERALMGRSDVWHKITVLKGTQYPKETVLEVILSAVEPADFVPFKYQDSGEDTFFLVCNCAQALDKLCKTNLVIKNPYGDPLILILTLGFASATAREQSLDSYFLHALMQKFNPKTNYVDLEQFHKYPYLLQAVYCPLSQPRNFNHVMMIAKACILTVEHMNLRKNGLSNLSPIEASKLFRVKYLDLRHNNLMNMEALAPLKNLRITKLWLDGNPLCENYSSKERYIESALRYCPNLVQLDGVYIKTSGLPLAYASYFKHTNEELIVKFVNHFFDFYDQSDRTILRGLYHKNAFYSMSFRLASSMGQKRSIVNFTENRNLLKPGDHEKKKQHIHYGQDNVLNSLKRLPRSCHDRSSFRYDLMYDDGKCLVFSVSGLFKTGNNWSQVVLWFNRTFVVQAGMDHEYNILNDQYHVDSTVEEFSPDSIGPNVPLDEIRISCHSQRERKEIVSKFMEVTKLSDDWCLTYLEEAKWNIRKAISNFIKDYKSLAVPEEAFS